MRTLTASFATTILLASTCIAEIHWTFHPSIHGPDGKTAPYVTTTLGPKEVRYVPPLKWACAGGRFIPPGKIEADAYVDALPIRAAAPWTPERGKILHKSILAQMVPKGAGDVEMISEGLLPVQLDGQTPYEVAVSYTYYGQSYATATIFVERGKTQLQFHFGSLRNDFADLYSAFIGSLITVEGF